MREPGVRGEASADRIELLVAQRADQVTPNCDLVCIPSGQTLLRKDVSPAIKRSTDL
jgi:hypothetical protein